MHTHTHTNNLCQNFLKLSKSDIKHYSPLNPPDRYTHTYTHSLTKSVTRLCESPASVTKKLQTYENSSEQFPHIMIHLDLSQHPAFPSALAFALCPCCQWHNVKFSALHQLFYRHPSTHSCPLSLLVCFFLNLFALSPSTSPLSHPASHSPPLLCLVYTRLLACPLSFQPLKAFQAANKRQVPTTTKELSAAFE